MLKREFRLKKRTRVIISLEKLSKKFRIIEEENPIQGLLYFQDKIYLKNRIELKNGMILEIVYHEWYISVYQPIEREQKRKLTLRKIYYHKSIAKIKKEIEEIISEIESFYV